MFFSTKMQEWGKKNFQKLLQYKYYFLNVVYVVF